MRSHPADALMARFGSRFGSRSGARLGARLGSRLAGRCLAVVMAVLGLAACAPQPGGPSAGYVAYGVTYERSVVLAVNFDFDSYRIRPESYVVLDNTAIAMGDPRFNGYFFEVNGHTDVTGRFGYNVGLSQLRAASVVDYLSARGVPRERMRPHALGPLQLYDPSPPRSPINRRVAILAVR